MSIKIQNCPVLDLVNCTYNVEEGDGITLTLVHGSIVSGDLFPGAVEVVGHQVEDVQRSGNPRDVVSGINDGLAGGDSSAELESVGLEGGLELSTPVSESFFLTRFTSLAVSLPALRVLPIQIQTIKLVLQKEGHDMVDESFPWEKLLLIIISLIV